VSSDIQTPDLGYRAITMTSGASRTYPFTGDGLDIWWAKGAGALRYSIDGGAPATVDTAGAGSINNLTSITGLAATAHTVTITAVGPVTLEGFTVYNGDRDRGITLFDATHSGASVDTFLADLPAFIGAVELAAPDLVTITLGGNDAGRESPSELEPKYLELLAALRQMPSAPSILVIGEFTPGPAMSANFHAPWPQYLAVIQDAANKSGCAFLDLASTMPTADTSGAGLYATDGLHPNDSGQKVIAGLVFATIR
jgi:hypothetical protein